jgi:hypothetical protein
MVGIIVYFFSGVIIISAIGEEPVISSHRKLLGSKVLVVNVAEKTGHDPVRYG